MVKITFEREYETNWTFAHIESDDGIVGHAKEVMEKVPPGVLLTIPPEYQPGLTNWMVKKCGFAKILRLPIDSQWHDVLMRE